MCGNESLLQHTKAFYDSTLSSGATLPATCTIATTGWPSTAGHPSNADGSKHRLPASLQHIIFVAPFQAQQRASVLGETTDK